MKKRILKFLQKNFIKNVMVVASGTVIAQIIGLLLLPIITRLYGPEAYGILGTFLAITAVLGPIAALTLPTAIVLPEKDEEVVSIIKTSCKLIVAVSLILTLILLLWKNEIVQIFQIESISQFLYFLPLVILLSGLLNIITQWLIRTGQYKIIASTSIYQPIIEYGGMILVGFFSPIALILITFSVLKTGITALLMYSKIKVSEESTKINFKKSSLNFSETLNKYRDFPLFRAPEVFISSLSYNLPVLMLTSIINPAAAGFYSIGRMALSLPSQLIGKAIGDVFYPRIAKASLNKESLTTLVSKSTIILTVIGFIPFGIVIISGPFLFSLVFGEEWVRAGEYAQWISLMSYSLFISRPVVHALPVIHEQKFHLLFTFIMTIIRVSSLIYGLIIIKNDIIAVALFSSSSAFMFLLLIVVGYFKCKKYMINNY